jgi:hypothetical protein
MHVMRRRDTNRFLARRHYLHACLTPCAYACAFIYIHTVVSAKKGGVYSLFGHGFFVCTFAHSVIRSLTRVGWIKIYVCMSDKCV